MNKEDGLGQRILGLAGMLKRLYFLNATDT